MGWVAGWVAGWVLSALGHSLRNCRKKIAVFHMLIDMSIPVY